MKRVRAVLFASWVGGSVLGCASGDGNVAGAGRAPPGNDSGSAADASSGATDAGDSGTGTGSSSGAGDGSTGRMDGSADGASDATPAGPVQGTGAPMFSPYKDTSIHMNWNTNVVSTSVGGAMAPFATDIAQNGGRAATLGFATGECGAETWAGVAGDAMASANVSGLVQAGIRYVVSTGGAAGSFTCGSDSGMATLLGRWASSGLVGVDFDIEAGQSQSVIDALVARIKTAHDGQPALRFSLTLATLAPSAEGAASAQSLGAGAQDSFNVYGDEAMAAVESALGFSGAASTWPSFLTINLMTMDYGAASAGICVVKGGACEMGESAVQAAYNLHDRWGVPYSGIELTPMIGGNDVTSESFALPDADTLARFAVAQGLAGVHYWSYDRDTDCPAGSASPTCNSIGGAGAYGYLKRFLAGGLQ
jgi:chitinase